MLYGKPIHYITMVKYKKDNLMKMVYSMVLVVLCLMMGNMASDGGTQHRSQESQNMFIYLAIYNKVNIKYSDTVHQ